MKIFLLIIQTLCTETSKTIQEVIEGTWNVTQLELTDDGLVNPDSFLNYSFNLVNSENNRTYYSDIYCFSSPYSHSSLDNSDESFLQSHKFMLSFNFSESSTDISSEKEYFSLTFDDNFTVEGELLTSVDSIRRSVGSILYPFNASYHFVIMSSYRAELTLFYRNINKTTMFRFMKQYHSGIFTGFGKYSSYLMRKMVFRMI